MAVHLQQSSMVKTTSHEEDRSSHVTHRFMLAHGNFGGAWVWAEFERELSSRGHTVYALDLPWERDPETGQVPGISDQAQHIKDLISSRQLKGVVLVGASNGGLPVIQVSAGAQVSCPLRCVFSRKPKPVPTRGTRENALEWCRNARFTLCSSVLECYNCHEWRKLVTRCPRSDIEAVHTAGSGNRWLLHQRSCGWCARSKEAVLSGEKLLRLSSCCCCCTACSQVNKYHIGVML